MGDSSTQLTPEQKLLKLIEQSGGGAAPASVPAGKLASSGVYDVTGSVKRNMSTGVLKGRFAYMVDSLRGRGRSSGESLKSFNSMLKLVNIMIGVVLLLNVIYESHALAKSYESYFQIKQQKMAVIPDYVFRTYDDAFFEEEAKKNIFLPKSLRVAEMGDVGKPSVEASLKLVGISLNPKDDFKSFCMIESLSRNQTEFLRVADEIDGFTIHGIYADKILLKRQDEIVELK